MNERRDRREKDLRSKNRPKLTHPIGEVLTTSHSLILRLMRSFAASHSGFRLSVFGLVMFLHPPKFHVLIE